MINARFTARSAEYAAFCIIFIIGFPITLQIHKLWTGKVQFQLGSLHMDVTWLLLVSLWMIFTAIDLEHGYTSINSRRKQFLKLVRINWLALFTFNIIVMPVKFFESSPSRMLSILYTMIVLLMTVGSSVLIQIYVRWCTPKERKLLVVWQNVGNALHTFGLSSTDLHQIEGIVTDTLPVLSSPAVTDNTPLPVLGNIAQLPQILKDHVVDSILVGVDWQHENLDFIMRTCQQVGINVELCFLSPSTVTSIGRVIHLGDRIILRLETSHDDPLGILLKRLTDVFVSLLLLIVLSPLFVAIAIGILTSSGGPILFLQQRVGLRGRSFLCAKFRTMVVDAESRRSELLHLNEMSGPVFKIRNDPRITPFGAWLRTTSLDELPQLVNVLLGHMSLVGPRPPLPVEVQDYDECQQRRLSVRPGITGVWQVSGRNNIDFEQWMQMDLDYIDNWSFGRDLLILIKTIPAVLNRKGAY